MKSTEMLLARWTGNSVHMYQSRATRPNYVLSRIRMYTRYHLNHAHSSRRECNVKYRYKRDKSTKSFQFFAKRDIQAGEELRFE